MTDEYDGHSRLEKEQWEGEETEKGRENSEECRVTARGEMSMTDKQSQEERRGEKVDKVKVMESPQAIPS